MIDPMLSNETLDRRGLFRIGGATIALSAIVAACGGTNEGAGPDGIASAGDRPPLATTPTSKITDAVLLRTATSLHHNAMDVTDLVAGTAGVDAKIVELANAYHALLEQQAEALAEATTAAGGEAFSQRNPAVDERVIQPAIGLLKVSDTPESDAARLLHAVASLAAATHQAFVPQFVAPALRQAAMSIGAVHSQVSAALAHAISPENIVPAADIAAAEPAGVDSAPETTVATGLPSTSAAPTDSTDVAVGVPDLPVYMVPSAFGPLSPVQIVLGKNGVDDSTKRQQLNIETPSLNSLIY